MQPKKGIYCSTLLFHLNPKVIYIRKNIYIYIYIVEDSIYILWDGSMYGRGAHLPKLFRFIQYHAKDYRTSCAHHNEYQTDSSGVLLAVLQHKTYPLIFAANKKNAPTGPRAHTHRESSVSISFSSFAPSYSLFISLFLFFSQSFSRY